MMARLWLLGLVLVPVFVYGSKLKPIQQKVDANGNKVQLNPLMGDDVETPHTAFSSVCDAEILKALSLSVYNSVGEMMMESGQTNIATHAADIAKLLQKNEDTMTKINEQIATVKWANLIYYFINAKILIIYNSVKDLTEGDGITVDLSKISNPGVGDAEKFIAKVTALFKVEPPDEDFVRITAGQFMEFFKDAAYIKIAKAITDVLPEMLCKAFKKAGNMKYIESSGSPPNDIMFLHTFFKSFIVVPNAELAVRGMCLLDKTEAMPIKLDNSVHINKKKIDGKEPTPIVYYFDRAIYLTELTVLGDPEYFHIGWDRYVLNTVWITFISTTTIKVSYWKRNKQYDNSETPEKTLTEFDDVHIQRSRLYAHYLYMYLCYIGAITKKTTLDQIAIITKEFLLNTKCWLEETTEEKNSDIFKINKDIDQARLGDCATLRGLIPPGTFAKYIVVLFVIMGADKKFDPKAKADTDGLALMFKTYFALFTSTDLKYIEVKVDKDNMFIEMVKAVLIFVYYMDFSEKVAVSLKDYEAVAYLPKAFLDTIVAKEEIKKAWEVYIGKWQPQDIPKSLDLFVPNFRTVNIYHRYVLREYIATCRFAKADKFTAEIAKLDAPNKDKFKLVVELLPKFIEYQGAYIALRMKSENINAEGFQLYINHTYDFKRNPYFNDKVAQAYRSMDIYLYYYNLVDANVKKTLDTRIKGSGEAIVLNPTVDNIDADYWALAWFTDVIELYDFYLVTKRLSTATANDLRFVDVFDVMYRLLAEVRSTVKAPQLNPRVYLWDYLRACIMKSPTEKAALAIKLKDSRPAVTAITASLPDIDGSCGMNPGEYGKAFYYIYFFLWRKNNEIHANYKEIEAALSKENGARTISGVDSFYRYLAYPENIFMTDTTAYCSDNSNGDNDRFGFCRGLTFFRAIMTFIDMDTNDYMELHGLTGAAINDFVASTAEQNFLRPYMLDAYQGAIKIQRAQFDDNFRMALKHFKAAAKKKKNDGATDMGDYKWDLIFKFEDVTKLVTYIQPGLQLIKLDETFKKKVTTWATSFDVNQLLIGGIKTDPNKVSIAHVVAEFMMRYVGGDNAALTKLMTLMYEKNKIIEVLGYKVATPNEFEKSIGSGDVAAKVTTYIKNTGDALKRAQTTTFTLDNVSEDLIVNNGLNIGTTLGNKPGAENKNTVVVAGGGRKKAI